MKNLLILTLPLWLLGAFIAGMLAIDHRNDTETTTSLLKWQQTTGKHADCETLYATGMYTVHARICGEFDE